MLEELAPGLRRWTARHPDWSPAYGWDQEVACFLVDVDDATVVVDPLVPDDPDAFWGPLDEVVEQRARPVAVVLTEAAHARDAGAVAVRYDGAVWGHADAQWKVGDADFHAIAHGDDVPGATVLRHDEEPGGTGTPIYFPSHRAAATGDVFIAVDGELRVWWGTAHTDDEWYGERLLPSLRRWLELPIDVLLIAHGGQVEGGAAAISSALERPPYRSE